MTICHLQASGTIELFFYGELDGPARADVQQHLTFCADCRQALDDMRTIRAALANRPDVSTPPGGDWNGFMTRLDDAIHHAGTNRASSASGPSSGRYAAYAAMAALVTLVTVSVGYVSRSRPATETDSGAGTVSLVPGPSREPAAIPAGSGPLEGGFASLSEQHFERSKLVVYGLANKDPRQSSPDDWAYERQLASALLSDTRLYRLAAEERGLKSVARVMGDLELVLLQTALSSDHEPATLQQLQSLIRKRDLVTKMNVVPVRY